MWYKCIGGTEDPELASKLTSEASGTRDKANRLNSVLPNRTSTPFIGGGPLNMFSSPFHYFEEDAIRLNHLSGNWMREGVIRSISELEESVRFAGFSKGSFQGLVATERSDCLWN